MARRPSPEALALLRTMAREPCTWRYGYELGLEVGLKAGTLYPILMRLSDRGMLEASWESDPPEGRPRRHLYRILADGIRLAAESEAEPLTAGRSRSVARPSGIGDIRPAGL
jgi:PadR family transcriptional regulator PadR